MLNSMDKIIARSVPKSLNEPFYYKPLFSLALTTFVKIFLTGLHFSFLLSEQREKSFWGFFPALKLEQNILSQSLDISVWKKTYVQAFKTVFLLS